MNVATQGKRPNRRLDCDGFEPALEKGSQAAMPAIEPNAVADVQPLHSLGQVGFGRLQHQMIMVADQYVGMERNSVTLAHCGQEIE